MRIIDWHAGFVSAMKLELREYEDRLTYYEEYALANRAQELDLLIINNNSEDIIDNPIGCIFSRHNILEYKGVGDVLTYGKFYKTLAYTSLYLYELHKDREYPASAYTMTFVRYEYPRSLFAQLKRDNIICRERAPGIYDVSGLPFRTQIVITGRLSPGTGIWLRSLTRHGTIKDVEYITSETKRLDERHKDDADNIMDIFTRANGRIMRRIIKEERPVCKAVNELFADEIKALKLVVDQKDVQLNQKDVQLSRQEEQLSRKDVQLSRQEDQLKQNAKEIAKLKSILLANNITYDEL